MRLTLVTCWLAVCWLAPMWAGSAYSQEQGKQARDAKPSVLWKENVPGAGVDVDTAKRVALSIAVDRVHEWMQQRHPEFNWRPSIEYLQQHGIVDESKDDSRIIDNLTHVKLPIRITQEQYDDLLKHDRFERVRERHWLWGKLLAAVVLLMALLAGYLRLEDATQGYLTRVLRVTLLLGVAVTLAGLWLVL